MVIVCVGVLVVVDVLVVVVVVLVGDGVVPVVMLGVVLVVVVGIVVIVGVEVEVVCVAWGAFATALPLRNTVSPPSASGMAPEVSLTNLQRAPSLTKPSHCSLLASILQ